MCSRQDPPEEIPGLIAARRSGATVVPAEKRVPGAPSLADRVASRAFHRLPRQLSVLETLTSAGSDFFLVSRPVVEVVNGDGPYHRRRADGDARHPALDESGGRLRYIVELRTDRA